MASGARKASGMRSQEDIKQPRRQRTARRVPSSEDGAGRPGGHRTAGRTPSDEEGTEQPGYRRVGRGARSKLSDLEGAKWLEGRQVAGGGKAARLMARSEEKAKHSVRC